jgi:hypothetical protein
LARKLGIQDHDAEAGTHRGPVLDQQLERLQLGVLDLHLANEDLGFVQPIANDPGHDGRKDANHEHAAPSDVRKQERRQQGGSKHAELPSQCHVRGHPRPLVGRPRFGSQRHADAELASEADSSDRAIREQVPVALCESAQAGEDGKQHDGPSHHANAAEMVAQRAEHDAAGDGTDERPGHQRAGLAGAQVQVGRDGREHEAQDEQVKPIHRIADRRACKRFPCIATDLFAVLRGCR